MKCGFVFTQRGGGNPEYCEREAVTIYSGKALCQEHFELVVEHEVGISREYHKHCQRLNSGKPQTGMGGK